MFGERNAHHYERAGSYGLLGRRANSVEDGRSSQHNLSNEFQSLSQQ